MNRTELNDHEAKDCHEKINDMARSFSMNIEAIRRDKISCKERLRKMHHRTKNFLQWIETEIYLENEK